MRTCCILSLFSLVASVSHAETDYSSVLAKQNSLQFMKNQGQFDPAIAYKSHYGSISLAFLQNHDLSYCISRELEGLPEEQQDTLPDFLKDKEHDKPKPKEYLTWNQTWLNSNKNAKIYELNHSKSKCNYFLGNDQSKWVKNADQYAALKYEGIYPYIDAHYYSKDNKFKYDYVVAPRGKVADIQVSYHGIKKLSINEQGQLIIQTAWGDFTEEAPFSYLKETKEEIAVAYHIINDSTFGFKAEKYNSTKTLIIDPYSLCWSTFLGGVGEYYSHCLEVLPNGEPVISGLSDGSHPITPGVFQPTYGGGTEDVFVSKLSSDGSSLLFSSFLGGNSGEWSWNLDINSLGEIIVSGTTESTNFPTSTNAFQTTFGGGLQDLFVSKLSNDGSNLVFSTFLGGNNIDQVSFVEVNSLSEIILVGMTWSNDFPLSTTAFQTNYIALDIFVSKLSSDGSSLIFSTYLGGNSIETPKSVDINSLGEVIIAGTTLSSNFPTSTNAFQTTHGGLEDVFVSKVSSDGSSLIYSTYLGGNSRDECLFTVVNSLGEVIILGTTRGSNFPTSTSAFQTTHGGGGFEDVFVSKVSSDGSSLLFSTFLGGGGLEVPRSMDVNSLGEVIIWGDTKSSNFPVSASAFQTTHGGGSEDVFVSKVSSDGSSLLYSTFLGGNALDRCWSANVNSMGEVIITGITYSSDFPMSTTAFQTNYGGMKDIFVSKLSGNGSLIYSTFLGGNNDDEPRFMDDNSLGEVITIGYTLSSNFPTTTNAIQTTQGGGIDIFVNRLSDDGSSLIYSTCLGGDQNDYSVDNKIRLIGCNLYMSPVVHSITFPVTAGAYQTVKTNTNDTPEVLKMSVCEDYIDLRDTSNCSIANIPFPAPIENGTWSDGSMTDTLFVNTPGTYWFEADTGCGNMYRDSFLVEVGSVNSFDILDTAVCSDALVNAPIAGGTWYDGSTSSPITINQEGAFWYEYYDATCDTTLRDSFMVSLHHPVPFQIPDTNACKDLTLNAPISGGVWSTGINTSPIIITTEGEYWFEFTDTCNITLRDSFMVDLGTLLKQDISDFIMCQGKIETIIPQVPGGVWSDGSSDGFYSVSTSGNYWYVYDDGCGNSVKDEFIATLINCDTITCKPPYFYIPNTFTPNLNNLNEDYGPSLGNCIEFFEFMVFDRWGELLFKTNSPSDRWNGYYLEVLAQEDVYVWKMTYKLINSKYFEEYGHVTVLR